MINSASLNDQGYCWKEIFAWSDSPNDSCQYEVCLCRLDYLWSFVNLLIYAVGFNNFCWVYFIADALDELIASRTYTAHAIDLGIGWAAGIGKGTDQAGLADC